MNVLTAGLCIFLLLVPEVQSKTSSAALKLLDKETTNTKCKSTEFNALMSLRSQGFDKKLQGCLIKSLNAAKNDGFIWSLLGELFARKGERLKANVCFKESIKLMGKLSKYVKKWHYIGPFTIGKNEIDGDPVQDWKGIHNISRYRWAKQSPVYYSEVAKGGEIKWQTINMNTASEPISIPATSDWNELIMSLQSLGIAEWQGWIIGDFILNEDGSVLVQCLGASELYINDTLVAGDLYKREYWNPVYLKRGIHSVMIKLRSKPTLAVNFFIKQGQDKTLFKLLNPPFLPDVVNGRLFSEFIMIPVHNLHHEKWLKPLKVSLTDKNSIYKVSIEGENSKFSIPPGQIKPINMKISLKDPSKQPDDINDCNDLHLNLKLFFKGKDEKFQLVLRCRKMSESFLFTFMDHDGSVQHGAAIAPSKGCETRTCPVLLTLHGTTVTPQSQADSYKRMEDGHWVFGLDSLWVLAPTRHGAHNWEGPGELTAISCLQALSHYTAQHSYIEIKADGSRMVVAGHSMGGHGAWILGTHHPDKTLALISAAGWIRKEDYGDSNLFFRHDISTSHASSVVKATMESCVAENDVDKHASNLHGISVLIRIGAVDRTVHPYYCRRMYRLLRQQKTNVTYQEIPGKEHWWWDTYKTNDGGVTNDPVIREFAIKHAKNPGTLAEYSGVCDKENAEKCGENSANKYKQQIEWFSDRNHVGSFTLTLYNPASHDGLRGIRVQQQYVPFRRSIVKIQFSSKSATIHTENVAGISLYEPAISPINWHQRHITIDEDSVDLEKPLEKSSIFLCRSKLKATWKACGQEVFESMLERGPLNLGPARRIAEKPFLIVTGTASNTATSITLRKFAVYIANQFQLTSDTLAHVIVDKDLDEKTADNYNLILIGQAEHNSWTARYHQHVPLKAGQNQLELKSCQFKASRTGALFLAPHAGSRLALVLTGNSVQGLHDVVLLATPTILPMARSPFSNMIPDFVITGPDFGARGPGGYACTGFWGNYWDYKPELTSCWC